MKILICGGGIAGNALAFWLSKLGHQITVLERFPSLRSTGLQIDLRGHGIQVLKQMGLEEKFRAKSIQERGLRIVDKAGRTRAVFPANTSGKGLQNFTTDYEIMRGDLCRMFFDENRERVKYIFGTTAESVKDDGQLVEVRLANGDSDYFNLVVGADGVGSSIRKNVVRAGKPDAFNRIKDQYSAYFTIPRNEVDGEEYLANLYMATGGRGIMTRRHRPDTIQVYLMCKSDSRKLKESRPGDVNAEKAAFVEIFEDAGWQAEDLLKSMADTEDFYCERMGIVKLDAWSRGRVTLVGDACYCSSANTGMGTTSALVGAYVLAGEIAKHCGGPQDTSSETRNLALALNAYEDKFRPFMAQVQEGVSEGLSMPTSALGIATVNLALTVAAWIKWNVFAEMVLKEKVKNWDLPEYEVLVQALATEG